MNNQPIDLIKQAYDKLNKLENPLDYIDRLPRQRNLAQVEYIMKEDDIYGEILVDITLSKYLDTSLLQVDIHPLWFQILIQKKSFLLHLSEEILVEKSKIQRITSTGHLHIKMPMLKYQNPISQQQLKQKQKQLSRSKHHVIKLVNEKITSKQLKKQRQQQQEEEEAAAVAKYLQQQQQPEINPDDYDFDINEVPELI